MHYQLYIHFPFCKRKCYYCDFCSFACNENSIPKYLSYLKKELTLLAKKQGNITLSTIFFGGGTPSLIPEENLLELMEHIKTLFILSKDIEVTIEANPGTVSLTWLLTGYKSGINRISFGMQAMQSNLLKIIGRIHNKEDVVNSVELAKKVGFTNISLDLMFGLPSQTLNDWKETLDFAVQLSPTHLSCYSLIVEEDTVLYKQVENGTVTLPNEDILSDMQEYTFEYLEKMNYSAYEVSNFSLPNYACKHNVGYWKGNAYLACGLAAHSYLPSTFTNEKDIRYENPVDFKSYYNALDNNVLPRKISCYVDNDERLLEFIMLRLRMFEGIYKTEFNKLFNLDFNENYKNTINKLVKNELAIDTDKQFYLTKKGMLLQNQVVLMFV